VTEQALLSSGLPLRELLDFDAHVIGSPDVRAAGCTSQWRHVRPGDVFVAVTESDTDGHDDASQAAHRGAAAIICERPLPLFDIPQFVVADSRTAYGQLCQALVGHPSRQMKVIGVAGTAGKTTVARLLNSIFRADGRPAGALDSLGRSEPPDEYLLNDAELSPPLLARSLAELNASGAGHAMVEIASRAASRGLLAGVLLDAVCLTHVGRGSLDWHGSLDNYRRAERQIIDSINPEGVAILNADDPFSMQILAELQQPVLTFGMQHAAEITAEIIEQHINEQTFVLTAGDESVGVRTEMIGDHHVYNCLAAAATALAYGIELTTIARGLEAVVRLPGRMERVTCGQPYAVFVDAANSPDALRACLHAARQVTAGRVICVFSPPGEREPTDRAPLGRVASTLADGAIVTSECNREKTPRDVLCDVRRGSATPSSARLLADRSEAIAAALRDAREGDTVVIAGTKNGSDREIVRSSLQASASAIAPAWPRLAA
jgi:UDP-N-acetylmuramoyl-L-alanyl-D-glutamate--2,6-diaminopimelate ligase